MCVRACVRACVCVCVRACVFYNNNSLRSSSFSKMRSFWHVSPNLNLLIHIIATAIKWLTVLNSEAHRFFWCKLINKAIFSVMLTVLLVLHLISLSTSFQIGFTLVHAKKSVLLSLSPERHALHLSEFASPILLRRMLVG